MEEEKLQKRGYSLYLDREVIKKLEDEKYATRKSTSFIVNEILKKRYNLK